MVLLVRIEYIKYKQRESYSGVPDGSPEATICH